jgi:hypothetical protein
MGRRSRVMVSTCSRFATATSQEDVSHGALIHEQEVRFSALRPLYLRLVDIFVRGSSAGFTYVNSTGP